MKRASLFVPAWFALVFLLSCPVPGAAKNPPFKGFDRIRLIGTGELTPVLYHPAVRVVDMRSSLQDYLKGHLPNAVYLGVQTLQIPQKGVPAQALDRICAERLLGENLCLSNDQWAILYSEKSNPNATLLAWALDYLGHKKIAVLDGGWEKWLSEKSAVTQAFPAVSPRKFFGKVIGETLVDKKWLRDHLEARHVVLIDARHPKQYSGEEGDEIRRGHIPGARNVFWETALEGDEVRAWKKREELERLFAASGVTRDKNVVVYCHTGREASHLYFTLKHVLGYPSVALYGGAWVEWSADPKMPVKTGADP
jgi:thiosulfate/3-mercaptopyruvate sulfurtransferase